MERFNPIPQAFIRIVGHSRMAEIERVTATGPVVVIAIFPYPIIATVINSAQGERGTIKIAFSSVVQHHIQNDLNARLMQRLYRIAEFIPRLIRMHRIAWLKRKHRQRVVTPVVAQPQPLQTRFAGEMRHRQQLQRGDPQMLQVSNHHRMRERLIGAADLFGDRRVQIRQPLDVRLVNHGFAPRGARRFITFPVVELVDHHAFWRNGRAVTVVGFAVANV